MKTLNIKICALLLTIFFSLNTTLALEQGTLQVTSIAPTQTLATPDGDFENGWQWIFNVTVPTNEKVVRLKFANWTSGTSTILTSNNVRFYSPQSTNSNSTSTAKILSNANTYGDTITLSSSLDLSPSTLGRQIQVVVDVKVPVGTNGGSYASSYGISSDIDPNQATGIVQYTINSFNLFLNGNHTDQIIGQVLVTAQNEDVKLNTLTLDPKFTDPNINPTFSGLTNIKLLFNGTQIGSTTSWNLDPEKSPLIFNFDSDVILPVGQQQTITVKSNLNFLESLTVSTGTLNTVIGGLLNNAQGVTTNRLISVFAIPFVLATTTLTNYSALSDVTISNTSGFTAQTKAPNSTQVKIGSFTINTGNSENITLTNIKVDLSGTALTSNQITNLIIKDGSTILGTPIGSPSNSNNFSTNIVINSNNTKVVDVYADFGSSSGGTNVVPSFGITVRGNNSNLIKTISTILGLETIIDVPNIQNSGITFASSTSPESQFIIAGQSNFQIGTFNFKTSNNVGGAMLKDITFTVPVNTISSITVNGKTGSVIGTTATITDVGIIVPSDNSGINVPIFVSLVCVNPSIGCAGTSNSNVNLSISNVTYNNGLTTLSLSPISMTTPIFKLVGSKPIVSVNSNLQSGLSLGIVNKIGEVTVSADSSGPIKINNVMFSTTFTNINSPSFAESPVPRITIGISTVPNSTCTPVGFTQVVNCNLNGYIISAGTSVTFNYYVEVDGLQSFPNLSSVSTTVSKNSFNWDDVNGAVVNLTGENIYNFPTNSYTIRQ